MELPVPVTERYRLRGNRSVHFRRKSFFTNSALDSAGFAEPIKTGTATMYEAPSYRELQKVVELLLHRPGFCATQGQFPGQ
jgi:hypothetical protein